DARELAPGNDARKRAGIAQRAGAFEIVEGSLREIGAVRDEFEDREQFVGRRHRIEVQHGTRGHPCDLGIVDDTQSSGYQNGRGDEPAEAERPFLPFDADHYGRGTRGGPASRYRHVWYLRGAGLRGGDDGWRIRSNSRRWTSASS